MIPILGSVTGVCCSVLDEAILFIAIFVVILLDVIIVNWLAEALKAENILSNICIVL